MTTQNQIHSSNLHTEILESLGKNIPKTVLYQFVRYPDGNKKFTYISENVAYITGKSAAEVMENPNLLFKTVLEKYVAAWMEAQEESYSNMTMFNFELECESAIGDIRWLRITSNPQKLDDGTVLWTGIQIDITEEKNSALKLQKNNRELALLNSINDVISNAKTSSQLLHEICRCLVEKGNYKLAWICKLPDETDPEKIVKPYASFGYTDYLKKIKINLKSDELRKGPTASVLLDGGSVISNNFELSNRFKPWLDYAREVGFSASGVFAIKFENGINGALNVYSNQIDAFDEHETSILNRVAKNITNAIENIYLKAQKEEALFLLKERNKELKTIYEISELLSDDFADEDSIFENLVRALPKAWLYNHLCEASLTIKNKTYATAGFTNSQVKQYTNILLNKQIIGHLTVVYKQDDLIGNNNPFLKEEDELLSTVADMIANFYSKKNTIKALTQSEANLRSVFNHTEIGYALIDLNYKVLSSNKMLDHIMFKFIKKEFKIGEDIFNYVLAERQNLLRDAIGSALKNKTPISYETSNILDQNKYYFIVSVIPVMDNNHVISICISVYDVTQRKNMELEQQKITSDLLQRNRDLEQFAFIVSHNLRAPVANILGLNMLLQENLPEDEKQNILEKISLSTQRLDGVVQDLNTILQVRREVSEIKTQVHFSTLIHNIKESIENILHDSHAVIETDFSQVMSINTIRTYLGSVFFNLITNSVKYAREGVPPHITITTHREGNNIIIRYKDNGRGIDLKKYSEQVFGLYKRFHTQAEGKGIGLFMTKTQVEVMGGKITINSEPNRGTEFTITLPEEED